MNEISGTLKRIGFVKTAFLLLFAINTQFAVAQVPLPEIDQARYQVLIDQPEKAKSTLKQAIAAHPEDASLWYYLGEVQIKTGAPKEAEMSFQKGIEKNDKEVLNLVGKGHLRLNENNVAEAKKLFDQALTLTKSKNIVVLK